MHVLPGPRAMFEDALPLQFGPGLQPEVLEVVIGDAKVAFSSKEEDQWQRKATDAAIAAARKIALSSGPRMNTPCGRLTDQEWGMITTAAIFAWIEVRVQQAIAEGLNQEQAVHSTGLLPSPCDVAVVGSILPTLADSAGIDWSLPLEAWSKEVMTNFLMIAWKLINVAETVRDHGPGKILKKGEFNPETGDPIPFDL
jgi:hypothetical protein